MGNVQQNEKVFDINFSVVEEVQLYHFGKVRILQQQSTVNHIYNTIPRYFKQSFGFNIQVGQQENFLKKLKTHNNQCSSIIQIKYINYDNNGICSPSKNINIYFQYLPITLSSIIERQKIPFSENQVWKLMKCLMIGVKFLNDNQSYHGDLCPQFIYFDNRTLKYKIFDSSYFNPLKNGYYRAQIEKIYCSPQVLSNISQKRTFPLYNHYISDTFSIGLILLYCMTLVCPLAAYDYKNYQIDFYYIQSLIRIATLNQYSQRLIEQIRKCLMVKNRPTVSELLENCKDLNITVDNTNTKLSLKK